MRVLFLQDLGRQLMIDLSRLDSGYFE